MSEVNTEAFEGLPFVTPDESYLFFVSGDRADEIVGDGNRYARGDLYVSIRRNGSWTKTKHLGCGINSPAADICPFVSPDGKYLFFTSERGFVSTLPKRRLTFREISRRLNSTQNGLGDIYRIEIKAVFGCNS